MKFLGSFLAILLFVVTPTYGQRTTAVDLVGPLDEIVAFALSYSRSTSQAFFVSSAQKQIPRIRSEPRGYIDIAHCYATDKIPNKLNSSEDENRLAEFIQLYSENYYRSHGLLSVAGYPTSVWEADLRMIFRKILRQVMQEYDSGRLEELYQNNIRQNIEDEEFALVRKLISFQRANPHLPKVSSAGFPDVSGCGGDYTPSVKLRTEDNAAQLFIINEFEYRLCERRNRNANDIRGCRFWAELPADAKTPLGGSYYYSVIWSDGAIKPPTKIRLESFNLEDKTVVIRRNDR